MSFGLARSRQNAVSEQEDSRVTLTCRRCRNDTPRDTLSTFGAMCEPCYRGYCLEKPLTAPDVGNKNANGPRDWIQAMRKRELMADKLTPFQRSSWREAMGMRGEEDA